MFSTEIKSKLNILDFLCLFNICVSYEEFNHVLFKKFKYSQTFAMVSDHRRRGQKFIK